MRWLLVNCMLRTTSANDGARVPLACLCLLAAAGDDASRVVFRDYQLADDGDALSAERFADFLDEEDADVVAISCMSNLLPLVVSGTAIVKARHPTTIIVLGGIGPSGVAWPLMRAFPHIDFIAIGEGEVTFRRLLAAQSPDALVNADGILFRADPFGDKLLERLPNGPRLALDDLPMPAYDRVQMHRYETIGVQTARGCPFPCKFCDVSEYWGRKTTYRSVPRVMQELQMIESYGFTHVEILDDTFIIDRLRTKEFCRAWQREGRSIRWSAYCRVDLLDDELINLMAGSGCWRVFLGIESGSNTVLRRISKPFDRAHLLRCVTRMAPHFSVCCNLMWGFPFETVQDVEDTLALMAALADAGCVVTLSLVSPLPLSRLYATYKTALAFRDDVQSSFISTRYFRRSGRLVDTRPDDDFAALIARHPAVFPGFYIFAHDSFDAKLRLLAARGYGAEKLSRQ